MALERVALFRGDLVVGPRCEAAERGLALGRQPATPSAAGRGHRMARGNHTGLAQELVVAAGR
jgi:hypothetical protein